MTLNSDALEDKLLYGEGDLAAFVDEMEQSTRALPERINADPSNVEKGLARLVLTVVELLRQLMERQALHRIEAGSLSDEEIDRMGETFMKLEQRMGELREIFDLEPEDLNLSLGPLGDLM